MSRSKKNDGKGGFSLEERCSDAEARAQLEHVKLIKIFDTIPALRDQLITFFKHITPDPQESQKTYDSIKKDTSSVLSKVFPPFTILQVGSTVSTLQFKSSDFDMHVHFDVRPGKARSCLVKTAEALAESELFHSVRDICTARIPIVKCVHVPTGMRCDMNFSFLSGVENSKLMEYFLSLDEKLRQSMLIIKYWGISRGIILKKKGFSKYSLVMMFIFYLQERFSFPSVCSLQQDTVPSTKRVKWNMNFKPTSNFEGIRTIKSLPLTLILLGFFEFYTDFNYDTHIISPYIGKSIEKSKFGDLEYLSGLFAAQSKLINSIKRLDFKHRICVQDPLELDRNTCCVSADNLARFSDQCSVAMEIITRRSNEMFINLISPIERPDSYFKVCLRLTTSCVESMKRNTVFESDDEITKLWFENTLNYCDAVFQRIFKFNVESEGHFRNNHSYTVTSSKHLWLNRDKNVERIKDLITQCRTNLEREIAISNSISGRNDNDPSSVSEFKCSIIITCIENKIKKSSTLVEVEFIRKLGDEVLFESFSRYMSRNLVFWFYEPTS